MLSKFLDPKNDLAFKRIFGSEKNKDILIHFLNDLFANTLGPVEDVTFLKPSLDPQVAAQRVSIVDVLCRDTDGDYFIVEMQVHWEPRFEKRAQYYAAKTYSQQREKKVDYKELKQVTFLAITNHILFPTDKDYLSHHHILNIKSHERHLKDLSFSFLELPKFKKRKHQLKSMVEKWAYFFKYAPETKEEDLKAIVGDDLIIQRAYEELNPFSWSSEELMGYERVDMKLYSDRACYEGAIEKGIEIGHSKGRAEGRAEGEEVGRQKERLLLAKRLLLKGIELGEVSEMTDLAPKELQELVDDLGLVRS